MTVQSFYDRYQKKLALQWKAGQSFGVKPLKSPSQIHVFSDADSINELNAGVACVVTDNKPSPDALKEWCQQYGIALWETTLSAGAFQQRVGDCEFQRSESTCFATPGTLVEVSGVGVLLQGKSGIGKSDLALGLIDKGHRLVADDLVEFRVSDGRLIGAATEGACGFMEVRGLGIANIQKLYGDQCIADFTVLDLVINLQPSTNRYWRQADRLGGAIRCWQRSGIDVPMLSMPYSNSRDMPLLVEVAARLFRLKQQGYDAASELEALINMMKQGVA